MVAACVLVGCTTLDAPSGGGGHSAGPDEALGVAEPIEQALYRVSYRGIDGRGRLRLVLRQRGEDFRLDAADPFGRPLWSFGTAGSEAVLLDHREATYCRIPGPVSIDVVALSELPVRALPRLLSGRLPAQLAEPVVPPVEGEIERIDVGGRRWRARYDDGELASWTLYQGKEPTLWWQRRNGGGILSHREGAQASWVRTASERVAGPLELLEPPPGYTAYRCTENDADDLA